MDLGRVRASRRPYLRSSNGRSATAATLPLLLCHTPYARSWRQRSVPVLILSSLFRASTTNAPFGYLSRYAWKSAELLLALIGSQNSNSVADAPPTDSFDA